MARHDEGASVCCIGGMTMDRELALQGSGSLGATHPVRSRRLHGGAARNVAEFLARLSVPSRLLSIVGDDQDGRELVLDTAQQGVDMGLVQKSLSRPTGSFIGVRKLDGSLFAGFADMEICTELDRAFIQNRWIQISRSPFVFADGWLPADSLGWLIAGCREHKVSLLLDPGSTATARHLPLNLNGVALLACGGDEARAILGDELERDAAQMAGALRRRGAARVIVATGGELVCAGRGASFALETEPDLLGLPAGRAGFAAGLLYARLQDRAWRASLSIGIKAALIAARGDEFSPQTISAREPRRRAD